MTRIVLNKIQLTYPQAYSAVFLAWFRALDFGRILSRIIKFISAVALYFFFALFIEKLPLKKTILYPWHISVSSFFYGMLWGGGASLISFIITIITGAVFIDSFDSSMIVYTCLVYFFAMMMTAVAEEIVFRGYMLARLSNVLDKHSACILMAIFFGYIHWLSTASLLYALSAFGAGLLFGYVFLLTRNIYYVIGLHFGWNFIESVLFSHTVLKVRIYNSFLAGSRITPDQHGFVSLLVILGVLYIWMVFYRYHKKQILSE